MTDILERRLQPTIEALAQAVADHDREAVAAVLNPLDRRGLEALAIVLAAKVPPTDTNSEKIRAAITEAARAFGSSPKQITGQSKYREDVDARAVACYAARLLNISYSEIGRHIGREHSTVMHACGRVGEDPRLRKVGQRIASGLGWVRGEDVA